MSLGSDSVRDAHIEDFDGVPVMGSVIAGKYRIERTLGVGGMGVVVAARHIQLNSMVAIKFLHEKGHRKGAGTARFIREARASAALTSEHVTRVVDVGTLDSGAPFMVMEYLEGTSLSKVIRKRAPLPIPESVSLMLQACEGLAEAHARGIVHRDIKPSNLFLTRRGDGSTVLKLLDFGISKAPLLADEGEATLTESQMVLGSPQYLSPEQILDVRTVDQRTDIWALGVVLYYMLAGRRPFEGDTVAALCVGIATEQPPRLIDLRPDVPPELDEIVLRCLDKDRASRVASANELSMELAPFASHAARVSLEDIGIKPSDPPPSHAGALRAPSSQRGLVPPSSGRGEIDPALPMAPTEVLFRRDDGRSVIALQATARPPPITWLPIVAGVVVVGALALFIVNRGNTEPPQELGGVAPVSGPKDAKPKETAGADDPQERSVVVPGSAKRPTSPKPAPSTPDFGSLLGANMLGTTQATLRLLDSVGGRQVIGVVPKGEIVMVKKVAGEWVLVTFVDKGKAVSGWTLRNLVQ